jgi:hypothetical protein
MKKEYLPNSCADCGKPIQKVNKHCHACAAKYRKGRTPTPIEIRFWKYVKKTPTCWIWTGTIGRGGYGRIKDQSGRSFYTHRFSYELSNGIIQKGKYVCHSCDIASCCNPAHLWIGDAKTNVQDCIEKGRFKSIRYNINRQKNTIS